MSLLAGLAGETPLGRVVAVRMKKTRMLSRSLGIGSAELGRNGRSLRRNILVKTSIKCMIWPMAKRRKRCLGSCLLKNKGKRPFP